MSDDLPFGNRFQFPFTREEVVRAHEQVMPPDEAQQALQGVYDPPADATGATVMDGTLLLLAALSEDLADRVLRYRPKLKEWVRRIRADPDTFLAEWRTPAPPVQEID